MGSRNCLYLTIITMITATSPCIFMKDYRKTDYYYPETWQEEQSKRSGTLNNKK
jgi:hypothetical protein